MAYEIERKFLLNLPPKTWGLDQLLSSAFEIKQGYLTEPTAAVEVRVRRVRPIVIGPDGYATPESPVIAADATSAYWLAVKGAIPTKEEGGVSRHELEVAIDATMFDQAWRMVDGRDISKARTIIMVRAPDDTTYEVAVDAFAGQLYGLILAEIEFADWAQSVAFKPPAFLGDEVTHDSRYRNASLAVMRAPPQP